MTTSESEQITPLLMTNSCDSHDATVETTAMAGNASSSAATVGPALPSIGKRKERDDGPEEENRNEIKRGQDSDATLSSDEDSPHAKKRRVGTSGTEDLSEESPTETATDIGEAAVAPTGSTANGAEEEQATEENRATAQHLCPVEGYSSSSSKKRKLSNGEDSELPSQSSPNDVPSGPSSSETVSSSDSSLETPDSGPGPAKKARLTNEVDESPTSSTTAPSVEQADARSIPSSSSSPRGCFLSLPLELLAEILILTGSPQHVLALARTCKALCATLLGPDAQFIWREARKGPGCTFEESVIHQSLALGHWGPIEETVEKSEEKLPDQFKSFFSEAAYAAFVFDGGKCDICGTETSMSYSSFALRARICKNPQCSKTTTSSHFKRVLSNEFDDPIYQLVPMNEGPFLMGRPYEGSMWPNAPVRYVRPEQLEAARAMLLPGAADQGTIERARKRNEEWMKFCVAIHKWNKMRVQRLNRMKETNLSMSKQIASSYGWEYDDLYNTIYGPYQLRKTRLIEKINEVDVKLMKDTIESQLLALSEKRSRRNAEITLMKNREGVETVYNRLRSTKAYPYMPSLPTFRKLPVVEMLQSAERPKTVPSVSDALHTDKVMKELLASQLKKWVEKAKGDLGVALGFPRNWKNASKNILHPVERVTGRFLCKRCGCVEPKYSMDGCLDFAGACLHVCTVGNKEKGRLRTGKKALWDPTNFVKDDKAINVLKASLAALGHAEDREAGNYLLTVGLAVVCLSCEPCIVLDSRSLIGHSHRHDDMKLSFASQDVLSYCGGFPYRHGLVQKLLGPLSYSAAGKTEIDRKNYGCRHCLRQKQDTELAAAALLPSSAPEGGESASHSPGAQDPTITQLPSIRRSAKMELIELSAIIYQMHDVGVEGPLEKPPPLFSFNGMRSHLKAKHHIEDIRDEDMFCFRDPEIGV